jgi:diguanylate cyclase (GGDEF)-like protein
MGEAPPVSDAPDPGSEIEDDPHAMAKRARVPLRIAMAMVGAVVVGAGIALDLPGLGYLGLLLLGVLLGSLRVIDSRPDLFRGSAHVLYALTLVGVAYAVFWLQLPSVITVYFPAMVLLGAAHILGTRAALFWCVPSILLVGAGVFLGPGVEAAVDPVITFGVRSATLLTILGFGVAFRRAHDRQAAELLRYATTDALTGLANRRELDRALLETLGRSERYGRRGALVFVDLDGVKALNDRLGHAAGDELIERAASRIKTNTRIEDTAARLGGDEFVVLLSEMGDPKGGEVFARKLLRVLVQPATIGGEEVVPSASIGVALFPESASEPAALLRLADEAMYQAKRAGGGRVFLRDADGLRDAT